MLTPFSQRRIARNKAQHAEPDLRESKRRVSRWNDPDPQQLVINAINKEHNRRSRSRS